MLNRCKSDIRAGKIAFYSYNPRQAVHQAATLAVRGSDEQNLTRAYQDIAYEMNDILTQLKFLDQLVRFTDQQKFVQVPATGSSASLTLGQHAQRIGQQVHPDIANGFVHLNSCTDEQVREIEQTFKRTLKRPLDSWWHEEEYKNYNAAIDVAWRLLSNYVRLYTLLEIIGPSLRTRPTTGPAQRRVRLTPPVGLAEYVRMPLHALRRVDINRQQILLQRTAPRHGVQRYGVQGYGAQYAPAVSAGNRAVYTAASVAHPYAQWHVPGSTVRR